jgi:hypothetical protein
MSACTIKEEEEEEEEKEEEEVLEGGAGGRHRAYQQRHPALSQRRQTQFVGEVLRALAHRASADLCGATAAAAAAAALPCQDNPHTPENAVAYPAGERVRAPKW